MNKVLKRLGISPDVQAFFHAEHLSFDYGGICEVYDEGFHYIPTTSHIWFAGNPYGPEVIVTNSAMEALAWYTINRQNYRDPASLALVSLGNLPAEEQLAWLRARFRRRKFTLAFGAHLLGTLTDIRVAGALQGKEVILRWQKKKAEICMNGRTAFLEEAQCTLHHFEKLFGLRTGIRTSKPNLHATYLTHLQHEYAQPNCYPASP